MKITLDDQLVKEAIINQVAEKLEVDPEQIKVVRITRHQGGLASAEVEVEDE